MLVLYLVTLSALTLTTWTLRRDIAAAQHETVALSLNLAWFASHQTELREENISLTKQRDAMAIYLLYLTRENTAVMTENEQLFEYFKQQEKLRKQ